MSLDILLDPILASDDVEEEDVDDEVDALDIDDLDDDEEDAGGLGDADIED